jgi:hypothetical protein
MLVLAMFIPICSAAVLFLFRFLFALGSEFKPATGRIERISDLRPLFRDRVRRSSPVLTLSSHSRPVVLVHPDFHGAFVSSRMNVRTAAR